MQDVSERRRRFRISSRITGQKLLIAASAAAAVFVGAASFAPAASASKLTSAVVQAGGMVRAGSAAAEAAAASPKPPSCHSITYRGDAGYISVQENNGRLQWGITMTPLSYSIGTWHVSTYLSGQKTSSGFNRTVTTPYIPHGSLSVPGGKVFVVQAEVVGPSGTFVNVPNACET